MIGGELMGLNNLPDIVTVKQLAEFLQISELTIKRAIKAGNLEAFKAGRDWRIEKESVLHWVKKWETAPLWQKFRTVSPPPVKWSKSTVTKTLSVTKQLRFLLSAPLYRVVTFLLKAELLYYTPSYWGNQVKVGGNRHGYIYGTAVWWVWDKGYKKVLSWRGTGHQNTARKL